VRGPLLHQMLDFGQRESVPMAEESTLPFLYRRRRELIAQIAALRGQLAPKERELEQVDKMLTTVGAPLDASAELLPQRNSNAVITDYAAALRPFIEHDDKFKDFVEHDHKFKEMVEQLKTATGVSPETLQKLKELTVFPGSTEIEAIKKAIEGFSAQVVAPSQKYVNMTIKELVIQALIDHFPKGGTMMEIRDFIRLGYGKTIEPSSMRPQMHRLKADGILGQDALTDTWDFQDSKRRQYTMYDHPSSRAAMEELKDDEIPESPDKSGLPFEQGGDVSNVKRRK